MLLRGWTFALVAMLSIAAFPRGAAAQSLTLIHPDDPSFDSVLSSAYPGIEKMDDFQMQRRFMVLLRNDSPVAANAYLVAWEIQASGGMTYRMQTFFVRKNYLSPDQDIPLASGKVCLVSPFLYAPPAMSGRGLNFTHISPAAYGAEFSPDQVQSVTATLDEAIFEDGTRAGPSNFQLSARYDCVLAAEVDEPASIRGLLEGNAPEGDVVLRLTKDTAPLMNPSIYHATQREDICAQYRGEVAQNLMMRYRFGGVDGLRKAVSPAASPVATANPPPSVTLPVEFSAKIVLTDAFSQNREVGAIYVGKNVLRVDEEQGLPRQTAIIDLAGRSVWTIFPERAWATEEGGSSVHWNAFGFPDALLYLGGMNALIRPLDARQPCSQLPNAKCETAAAETVDGRACDTSIVTETEPPPQGTTETWRCIDPKLHFSLRAQFADRVYELHDVKEAAQDPALFQIPASDHQVFADGREAGPSAQAYDLTAFRQNSYSSHSGQTLASMGLSEGEIARITEISGVDASAVLARHVDMGEGADNGLAVQGNGLDLCGATGNCASWFFRKAGGQWQLAAPDSPGLGESTGVFVAMFAFVPPKHNGFFEMILMNHLSVAEYPFEVWWFDGTKYVPRAGYCWYPGPNGGQVQESGCH